LIRTSHDHYYNPESFQFFVTKICVMLSAACSYRWGVGQLADRRTVNPEVAGSSPAAPAFDFSQLIFAGD
jgi:hypothetical protein